MLIIKDCVKAEDQEPRVIWLRTGPGLSIVSYTRVCHHSDFCNDVSSTEVLGDLPTPTGATGRKGDMSEGKDLGEKSVYRVILLQTLTCPRKFGQLTGSIPALIAPLSFFLF